MNKLKSLSDFDITKIINKLKLPLDNILMRDEIKEII